MKDKLGQVAHSLNQPLPNGKIILGHFYYLVSEFPKIFIHTDAHKRTYVGKVCGCAYKNVTF